MTRRDIDAVLERVRAWPAERQDRAAALLIALEEEDEGAYVLSDEELAAIEEAEAQAARGEFATDEEMKALFDQYRHP
jgi:predicted transcriptional regulator